jgi:predicted molibdopterin-dependent oxidoreductase YjgC
METISITIDNQDIKAQKGATILETALANNIYIPHLCYHPDLKPAGSCRVCLVEMDDGKLVTSCRIPVKEGMVIKTNSPEVDKVRRPLVEMIMANHHMDCKTCDKKGRCVLQKIRAYMKIDKKRIQEHLRFPEEALPPDDSNPFFTRDHNKCVLCGICVRTCQEIQKVSAIDFSGRGNNTKISPFGDKPIAESQCVSCGECVIRCPVGALVSPYLRRPAQEVKTICPYCSVGCSLFLGIRDNAIVNVRADIDSPVNKGHLCVKGRFGLSFVTSPDRLTSPLLRQSKSKGPKSKVRSPKSKIKEQESKMFKEVSWDKASEFIATKLKKYKAGECALIASTKCTNEDNYIAQKFARVVMGSNNIDTSVRMSHAPSLTAMFDTIGMGTTDNSMTEIEQASSILIVGANITDSHPIIGLRVKKAVENGARLVVISPQETAICRFAEVWMKPYPGTDLALLMGMGNVIVENGLFDNPFIEKNCDNFEDFKESLEDFPLGRVERITGVPREKVEEAAMIFATNKPGVIMWSTGITQYVQGTNNVLSIINLSLLTGMKGLYSLWGQNNALGACDMGCLPDFYPGYQSVVLPEAIKKFESLWGKKLNKKPGLTLHEIIDATHKGKIKALYIIGSDILSKLAPEKKVKDALKKAELIIHQDIFLNETSQFAHVVLPSASFAEKDGTFTNAEKRVQRISKALPPSGNALPDWEILCKIAKSLKMKGFDFNSSEEIMSEISSVTADSPVQKARFLFTPLGYKSPAEVSDIDYPLVLTTERNLYSAGFLSRKVEGLKTLRTEDNVYINPKDGLDFGVSDGEGVRVTSRWGTVDGKAHFTKSTPTGLVSIDLVEAKLNQLMNPSFDEKAKTPEMKICAVRIEPLEQ